MEVHVPQGEGAVFDMVSGIFRNLRHILLNGGNDVLIDDRLVCEKLTIFLYAFYCTSLNSVSNWFSYDI